jgi:hypothetical protein
LLFPLDINNWHRLNVFTYAGWHSPLSHSERIFEDP